MIINADSLVPHIREKMRPTQSDASRHLLCPHCAKRTRLNTLGDGRKKCTVCGKKFAIHKASDTKKLQQCAEILLCFCLDFTAHRTAQITHHRYRLVARYYDRLRTLLTDGSSSADHWKENNKDFHPHLQARKIIKLLPMDFISSLTTEKERAASKA